MAKQNGVGVPMLEFWDRRQSLSVFLVPGSGQLRCLHEENEPAGLCCPKRQSCVLHYHLTAYLRPPYFPTKGMFYWNLLTKAMRKEFLLLF